MNLVMPILKKFFMLFKNLKLRSKIALSTAILLILSTSATLFFIYFQSKSFVEKKSYNDTHEITNQLVNYYNEKLTSIIHLTQGIFEDQSFKQSLNRILWDENYNYAVESTTMQELFQKIRLKDPFMDSFFLYTDKGVFYDNSYRPKTDFDFTKTRLFEFVKTGKVIKWHSSSEDEIFENNSNVIPVVLSTTIEGVYERAVLVVNLKESRFIASLKNIKISSKAGFFLFNTDGTIVTSMDSQSYNGIFSEQAFSQKLNDSGSGFFNYIYNKNKLHVNYSLISINGWKVIMIQPESEILKDVSRLQLIVLLVGLFTLIFSGVTSVVVAKTITRPVYSLRETILKVQNGELGARFLNRYSDEIGQLGDSFNNMLDEIQGLIRDLEKERIRTREEQKLKAKAEIKALQAQINPHFIYNTLDSIYWKAGLGENKQVSEMIISLSKLLRIGLSKGMDKIPVSSELEHVRNYLYLQSNMYKDKFDYDIRVEGDITGLYMVKILLQPIVENALLHGFDNIDYKGRILVEVKAGKEEIHFIIRDNGKGMDAKRIKDSMGEGGEETSGYALKNVYQRLKLNYGEKYGIYFNSEPYTETVVEIIIPAEVM